MKIICITGDSRSWTISLWIRPADGLLVPTGLSTDAGAVFATCPILRSILWTADPIHEQHEDAYSWCRYLATGPGNRCTTDSKRTLATRPATDYGNIHHATPIPYAMKLIIDQRQLIVTYDTVVAQGLSRKSFCHIPTPTFIFKFSTM